MVHEFKNEGERVVGTAIDTEELYEIYTINAAQMAAEERFLVKPLSTIFVRRNRGREKKRWFSPRRLANGSMTNST